MANMIITIITFLFTILYIKLYIRKVIIIKMNEKRIIQFKYTIKELDELMIKFESQLNRKPIRHSRWKEYDSLYENSTYDIIFFGYLLGVRK